MAARSREIGRPFGKAVDTGIFLAARSAEPAFRQRSGRLIYKRMEK